MCREVFGADMGTHTLPEGFTDFDMFAFGSALLVGGKLIQTLQINFPPKGTACMPSEDVKVFTVLFFFFFKLGPNPLQRCVCRLYSADVN